ncbi:NUDIX domain-containing protein [Streptomyces populi]
MSHGAARELCEETGLDLDPAHLRLVQAVHHQQSPEISRTGFFFEATQWIGTPVDREPAKCLALEWSTVHELPQDIIEYPEAGLRGYLDDGRNLQRAPEPEVISTGRRHSQPRTRVRVLMPKAAPWPPHTRLSLPPVAPRTTDARAHARTRQRQSARRLELLEPAGPYFRAPQDAVDRCGRVGTRWSRLSSPPGRATFRPLTLYNFGSGGLRRTGGAGIAWSRAQEGNGSTRRSWKGRRLEGLPRGTRRLAAYLRSAGESRVAGGPPSCRRCGVVHG